MDQAAETSLAGRMTRMEDAAWEQFCRLYGPPLLAFVRYALGFELERAEEVVQMTLVRCVRAIGAFDPARGALLAWVKAIARNEAHTLARRQQKSSVEISHSAFPPAIVEQILQLLDTADLPDEILARRDLQRLVQGVLLGLGERQREALVLKYMEGQKVAEMARQLGTSEKAVESLLSRSREAFRTAFVERLAALDPTGKVGHR